ncbi:hypothetical protein EXN66_Car000299 [Channa argus]|uniref:Uncharacterized protein n=1 Tax=Channa argus TaxID=215402 RepID=A0A6G1QYH5_CHAAH|nr:hypothetical protein EXN66_Car000299 [Channa argus]
MGRRGQTTDPRGCYGWKTCWFYSMRCISIKEPGYSQHSEERERQLTSGPPTGGVIGGVLGIIVLICIIIAIVYFVRKRQEDGEGPPKHKPPPPVKAGSSTEMLNKPSGPPTATETAPLSPGEVYYEPTGGEPVTNLDDETTGALNGGAPPGLDDSAKYDTVNERKGHAADGHHGSDLDSSNHEPPPANISRGESFVSPALYV